VAGLARAVTVHRDRHGIPHVQARDEADAFFALGFVHAQDRLAQMTWLARLARGRAAAARGEDYLPADRLARTLDFAGIAERELSNLDPETQARRDAYARGVNARIARIQAGEVRRPRALVTDSAEIAPWTPADSLAVFKLYSWGLAASLDAVLVLTDIAHRLGGYAARRFYPEPPAGLAPLRRPRITAAVGGLPGGDPLRAALGLRGHSIGSSAWVLSGRLSASGVPMLVADAHLETTAPSLYYLAHLRGGGLDVAGATLPGVPVFLSGRNGDVVWASTNARAVVTDLYEETVSESDPDLYYDGTEWAPLERRVEAIEVRGGDPETLNVAATRHGPLIGPLLSGVRDPLAVAWTGARADGRSGIASLHDVARSTSTRELRRALAGHEDPPLAVAYAGSDGRGGVQVAGWIPRRPLESGMAPMYGRARRYDWDGRIEFERLPSKRLRDGVDWAIAADAPYRAGRPPRVEWLWRSGARAERIEAMLQAATRDGGTDLRTLSRLQTDVALQRARDAIGLALRLADLDAAGREGQEIAAQLQAWDGRAASTSTGAAVYAIFLEGLTRRLLEPVLGETLFRRYLELPLANPDEVVFGILRDAGDDEDWPIPTLRDAIHASLRETWLTLSYELGANRDRWQWGRLHALGFRSFFAPPGAAAADPALGPFPYGGGVSSVNAAEWSRTEPFAVRVASTFRMAADVASLDHLLVSLAPGQSEHPGHPHYADAVASWREGRPFLLTTALLAVEEASRPPLVLEPAP